jgi:hypothetical protein
VPELDPVVKFASLIFLIFTAALSLAILLPKVRQSRPYQLTLACVRPALPYLGWMFFFVGSSWAVWGLFQPGHVKLLVGLGVTWAVLGVYVLRVGYEAGSEDSTNATDLKVITLCLSFSFAFLFLLLNGARVAPILP